MNTPKVPDDALDALVAAHLEADPGLGAPRLGPLLREQGKQVAKDRLARSVARVKRARALGMAVGAPDRLDRLLEVDADLRAAVARRVREAEANVRAQAADASDAARRRVAQLVADVEALRERERLALADGVLSTITWSLKREADRRRTRDTAGRREVLADLLARLETLAADRAALLADLQALNDSLSGGLDWPWPTKPWA